MNVVSMILFWLGCVAAGLVAVGMEPYPCGVPLLILAVAVCVGSWRRSNQSAKVGPVVWWILLTVGYLGWRMVQSPVSDFARSDALLLAGTVLGFWWAGFCGDSTSFPRWLVGMWALLLANVGVAAWQEFCGPDVYELLGERTTKTYPSGLYLHYNHFANFLLGIGLLSFGYGMAGRMSGLLRAVSFLVFGASVYGIYLAHSRGAWLALSCGTSLVLLGWLINLRRIKTSWAGVALVVAAVLAPLMVTGAWQMGQLAVSERNNGDSGRLEFASIALDLIQEKPVWGGGSRSYFFDSFAKWNPKELWVGSGDIQYVHNEYLQAAVDYGLLGLLLLLGVMALVFFRGVVLLFMGDSKSVGDRGVALGCMAALCGMGVQAFFSFVYHVLPDVILMGACIGWLVRQPWVLSEPSWRDLKNKEWVRFHWVHGVVGLVIGLLVMTLAARDAAAWVLMFPRFDFRQKDPSIRAQRLQRALEACPDFRYYGYRARILGAQRLEEKTPVEQKMPLVHESVKLLQQALERAPDSYPDWVHLAMLYDLLGRHDQAEPIYQRLLPIMGPREMQYGTQYLYARHLVFRAQELWRKRQPEQALALFLQAKQQLQTVTAIFRYADPSLREVIEKSIKFLEGAGIKPAL